MSAIERLAQNDEQKLAERNERILKIWIGKRRYAGKHEAAEEIAERCNMSIKKSFKELDYMKFLEK